MARAERRVAVRLRRETVARLSRLSARRRRHRTREHDNNVPCLSRSLKTNHAETPTRCPELPIRPAISLATAISAITYRRYTHQDRAQGIGCLLRRGGGAAVEVSCQESQGSGGGPVPHITGCGARAASTREGRGAGLVSCGECRSRLSFTL